MNYFHYYVLCGRSLRSFSWCASKFFGLGTYAAFWGLLLRVQVHVSCFVPATTTTTSAAYRRCIAEQLFASSQKVDLFFFFFAACRGTQRDECCGFYVRIHIIFRDPKSPRVVVVGTCRQSGSCVQYIKLLTITASPGL